jgi:hypothetical protein
MGQGPFVVSTRLLLRGRAINKVGAPAMSDSAEPLHGGTSPSGAAAFAGRWKLRRDIRHGDGLTGQFEGTAEIAPAGPGLYTYDEEGMLKLGDSDALRGTRRYLWRASDGAIDISFADGRPFHRLDLGGLRPETVHLCSPDRYAVAYDFTAWPEWSARWRVEGPRKDYVMTSHYAPF